MLVPTDLKGKARDSYIKAHTSNLSKSKPSVVNKHVGLRVAGADKKQQEKQKVEAKAHLASKGKPSAPSSR